MASVRFSSRSHRVVEYSDVCPALAAAGDVLYYGGYVPEAGLLIRQLRDRGDGVQLASADGLASEDFWLIAGTAGEGTLFTSFRDPSGEPGAAAILARARERRIVPNYRVLYSYGAVQAWAAAVERAGSLEAEAVIRSLHSHEFDTVLGHIRFDEKGDVLPAGFEWFVWTGGEFVPEGSDRLGGEKANETREMRSFPIFFVLAIVASALPAQAEVRIGLATPLTGPMAWSGAVNESKALNSPLPISMLRAALSASRSK